MEEKKKAGRPEIPSEEKRLRVPIAIQKRFHDTMVEKFKAPMRRLEKKLIKELDK